METLEVTVHPRQHSQNNNTEPAHGQENSGDEKENGAERDPYWARDDDERREEDEAQNGAHDGEAR